MENPYEDMLNWTNDVPPGSVELFQSILANCHVENMLEIGCYHGTSLAGLLKLFPNAKAVGVDLWDNTIISELSGIDFNRVEKLFDRNTCMYNVEKRKGDSKLVLPHLLSEGRKFDLIYVDGSHTAFDVYHDAVFAWMLLNEGGMMIFDDYLWYMSNPDVLDVPYHAINHFLKTYKDEYDMVHSCYRVFIRKRNPDLTVEVPGLGKFSLFENDKICKVLAQGNIWEPWLQNIFSSVVKSGQTVVDAGAYIGSHTVKLAQLCNPGTVHAFEPVYHNKLRQNVQLNNLTNVVVHEEGLSDVKGEANATWVWNTESNPGSSENNYGCTGLDVCPMGKPNWLKEAINPNKVVLRSLDSYNLHDVGFIKMDVEGLERQVIKGALDTIRRCRPVITLECWKDHNGTVEDITSTNSAISDLRDLGYVVIHIYSSDFLAIP